MRKINYITDNWSLIIVACCLLLILAPYVHTFGTNELSDCHSVWAEFGDYLSGTVAILSVLLIYLTYRDQSRANRRESFERLLYRKIDTIVQLQKRYDSYIKCLTDVFLQLFLPPIEGDSLENYPVIHIELALKRIYYQVKNRDYIGESVEEIEDMLRYIGGVLSYICSYPLIGNREDYFTEVRTLLSDKMKVILFLYVVFKTDNKLFQIFKENGFFRFQQMGNELFSSVVDIICKKKSSCYESSLDTSSIMIDNNNDELNGLKSFMEIVSYYNNKKKPHISVNTILNQT